MKKLKQIVAKIKSHPTEPSSELNNLLWQYICYSPKMPVRLHQEKLLDEAEKSSLKVNDDFFAHKELHFNTFKWGRGMHKVILTHGWGSKAADFNEIITALLQIKDLEIIAFDAPGNGSSEGELSNLLLYVQAVKAIILHYGEPDIIIGHSLGAMANVIALKEMMVTPALLISLTPLIRLKENFEASMNAVGISPLSQLGFFEIFEDKFKVSTSYFTLNDWYSFNGQLNHWLAYDQNDPVSPYSYMKEFLDVHPFIKSYNYNDVGHDKILKSSVVVSDLVEVVKSALELLH